MTHATRLEVRRISALARALAESLCAVCEPIDATDDWRMRVAAGHAHAIEDLLREFARTAPLARDESDTPAYLDEGDGDDEVGPMRCVVS